MQDKHKPLQVLIILVLVFGMCGSATVSNRAAGLVKAPPGLAQVAHQTPNKTVTVIVQKMGKSTQAEALVSRLGGKVTKDLHIINAFTAELSASAALELAKANAVKWVSLDAPVAKSNTMATTLTWATGIGSLVTNGFTDPANMVDSEFGENGTYGYGSKVKGSFKGFAPEMTPGNAIIKVEIALQIYTSAVLSGGDDPHVLIYVGGKQVKNYGINHALFAPFAGVANVGTLYVDLTPGYTWHWSDFGSGVEVVIDQSMFKSGHVIYYDAVGLRVTSDLGNDSTFSAGSGSDEFAPIDSSNIKDVFNSVVRSKDVWNVAPAFLQGQGVTVAVVDSGISQNWNFGKRIKNAANFNKEYHNASDRFGHGTFVASVIGSDGRKSNGQYIGIAPQVKIVNVRVSNDQGMATESEVVDGLQWILDNKERNGIRVVNLSLNSSVAQSYHTSPLDAAVEILWFNGIVVVVSSGNNSSANLYPPANDPFVITVGATDDRGTEALDDDVMASFSAYGTSEDGSTKPDLVAPGTKVMAYMPNNGSLTLVKNHPNKAAFSSFTMSGTSVSAPMVSGAVALLLQDEPNLTPDQVKYRLMATANKSWPGYDAAKAGAGYLDIYAAVYGTTTQSANTGINPSQLLWSGNNPIAWDSVAWNSVAWNSVAWNSVAWNSVAWNSVAWNSDYWDQ